MKPSRDTWGDWRGIRRGTLQSTGEGPSREATLEQRPTCMKNSRGNRLCHLRENHQSQRDQEQRLTDSRAASYRGCRVTDGRECERCWDPRGGHAIQGQEKNSTSSLSQEPLGKYKRKPEEILFKQMVFGISGVVRRSHFGQLMQLFTLTEFQMLDQPCIPGIPLPWP